MYVREISLRGFLRMREPWMNVHCNWALSHYLGDCLGHPALRSYRTSVRSFIPAFAQAEVVLPGRQFPPHPEDEAYRIFAERVSRTNYDRKWKPTYRRR